MKKVSTILICLIAACAGDDPAATVGAQAELIFFGGPIYTASDNAPITEAVAVSQGRIIAVGNLKKLAPLRNHETRMVDLNGAAMFPGFTDSHVHLRNIGRREVTLDLSETDSLAEFVTAVEEQVKQADPGEVVFGAGWLEATWPEGRFPTKSDIDLLSPDNPVVRYREDRHALLVNTAALDAAGITTETPDPKDGRIEKDESGRLTGILIDTAMHPVARLLEEPSPEAKREMYKLASDLYKSRGWTGVHNVKVSMEDVALIEEMSSADVLQIRVYNSLHAKELKELKQNIPQRSQNGRIVTRSIKLQIDGALGSRGALLDAPYTDMPETKGLLLLEKQPTLDLFKTALKSGVQVNTHAIGNRGNRLVLDWYEEAFSEIPPKQRAIENPRWRIEHASLVNKADIHRFAEMDVIASVQPSFVIGDFYFAPARLGAERLSELYAWRSLLNAGVMLAGGSDAPVERGDPLIEFYAAVARRDFDGTQTAEWQPNQAVSRTEALNMLTLWPAYASFQEDELGSIEVGKRADFTVFSKDIMEIPLPEILKARAVMTVIDGEIVYTATP